MFDSTKEDLRDILKDADDGKLQLPDFQRDYVWTDEDVRSLVASVAKGFPVGALLTLESGSAVRFKPRLIVGVDDKDIEPSELLLDGQQRITSLYQATYSSAPVTTSLRKNRKTKVERHYYLDMQKALDSGSDLYDAIVGVPADRIVRTNFGRDVVLDLSSPQNEFENDMFPLHKSFDSKDWFYDWRDYCKANDRNDVLELEKRFNREVLEKIERYKMPIIRLDKDNGREAICLVFEKVNVGGQKLDPFELLTAIYAADSYDLRVAWAGLGKEQGIKRRLVGTEFPRGVLKPLESTDFIQACTLLHTYHTRLEKAKSGAKGKELPQVSCSRESLLSLPLSKFKEYAPSVEKGFVSAAAFLNEQKFISHRDIPYNTQVIALAAVLTALGSKADSVPARNKLAKWFWNGALGELYGGGSSETRMAKDLQELVAWIAEDGPTPDTLNEAIFQQDRLKSLRARLSAAYKAIHALMMRHGCRDFVHGDEFELMSFFERKIDIHHIFPRAWCIKQGIDKKIYDSVINKTPLSKRSNIAVGGVAPSVYLRKIEKKTGITSAELDDILRTHLIEPEHLRNDDFHAFFQARMEALSSLIEGSMGKPVVTDQGSNEPMIELEDDVEDEDGHENDGSLE